MTPREQLLAQLLAADPAFQPHPRGPARAAGVYGGFVKNTTHVPTGAPQGAERQMPWMLTAGLRSA